jgi:signal transduction histidine kinase
LGQWGLPAVVTPDRRREREELTTGMSATASPARAAFEQLVARLAVGLRLGAAVAGSVGALLGLGAPAAPAAVGIAVAGLLGWAAWYAVGTLRHGWSRWLVGTDILVVAALCLGFRWLVPAATVPGWATWLAVVASSAVVLGHLSPWPVLGAVGTVAVPAAYTAGMLLSGRAVAPLGPLLVVQGIGAGAVLALLRRRARAADEAIAQQEALQRDAAVRESRRADEREHCRLLHDSVSATLTVVAAGGVPGSPTLRAQASRDLEVVEQLLAPAGDPADAAVAAPTGNGSVADQAEAAGGPTAARTDLGSCLAAVVAAQPALTVELAVAELAVPAPVAAALADAAAEALRNAALHAGVDRVRLRAGPAPGGVLVELADDGRGFDPAQVPAHRRGLRESMVARMARVGGAAAITSRPGDGTRVALRWPARPAEAADPSGLGVAPAATGALAASGLDGVVAADASSLDSVPGAAGPSGLDDAAAVGRGGFGDLVADRYRRGFELAVVLAAGLRHVGSALVPILGHRGAFRSAAVELVAWAVLAAVGVVGAVRLLRRRSGLAVTWLLAAVALAASAVATAGIAPGQQLTIANWSLGATGWFGVVVLLRRPIVELGVMIIANGALTLGVLLHDGGMGRHELAHFLLMAYAVAALQFGFGVVGKALDGTARQAATAAERQAAVRRRVQVAEALHRSRLDRYRTVRRSLAPLLVGLASGELDPTDRRVQRRCAVEGSRLRRLFAEADDVPEPLLHELRACADIADRRGVPVELQVIGRLPALSRQVRRALTEAPLYALAGAHRQARVTVVGRSNEVAISVLADARVGDPAELPSPVDQAGSVTVQESVVAADGENCRWIEARWRG